MQDVQDVIDRIPPEAWPLIDILFRVTIGVVIVWLILSIVAYWRRKAYNLTVASTAKRSKKAQPDFLKVDNKAREAAIERGERHEDFLDDREEGEALAALKAAKDPLSIGQRFAGAAAFAMSIFTLATVVLGVIANIGKMGETLEAVSSLEKIKIVIGNHMIGTIVAVLVVVWHIYKYFQDRKWKEA